MRTKLVAHDAARASFRRPDVRASQVLAGKGSMRPLPTLAQRHRKHLGEEESGRPERGCSLPTHGMPISIPTHSIRPHGPFRKTRPGERGHQQPDDVTGLHGLQNQYGIDVRHRSTRSSGPGLQQQGSGPECTGRSAIRHALPTTMTMSQSLSVERCRLRARRLSTLSHFAGHRGWRTPVERCRVRSDRAALSPIPPGRLTPGPMKKQRSPSRANKGGRASSAPVHAT